MTCSVCLCCFSLGSRMSLEPDSQDLWTRFACMRERSERIRMGWNDCDTVTGRAGALSGSGPDQDTQDQDSTETLPVVPPSPIKASPMSIGSSPSEWSPQARSIESQLWSPTATLVPTRPRSSSSTASMACTPPSTRRRCMDQTPSIFEM